MECIDGNFRLLLVEDNAVNQFVASSLLEQLGFDCDLAGNGVDAIAALKRSTPGRQYHLVLMDCEMPEMDGYEASSNIRAGAAGERYCEIPIIAMTANAMVGDRDQCMAAGMSDYVTKPVDIEELELKLKTWLSQLPTGAGNSEQCTQKPNLQAEATLAVKAHDSSGADPHAGEPDEPESQSIWDRANAIDNLGGSESLYAQLCEAALEDTLTNLKQLKQAIADGDFETAKIAAHSIKGVAVSIGGMQLMAAAHESELAARESNGAKLKECYPGLVQRFEQLNNAMSRLSGNA